MTDHEAQRFFADMFSKPVTIDGREMTMREAYIRATHARALGGDVSSHVELLKLRQACGAGETTRTGHLIVPEPLSDEEFERFASEQQRSFREQLSNPGL